MPRPSSSRPVICAAVSRCALRTLTGAQVPVARATTPGARRAGRGDHSAHRTLAGIAYQGHRATGPSSDPDRVAAVTGESIGSRCRYSVARPTLIVAAISVMVCRRPRAHRECSPTSDIRRPVRRRSDFRVRPAARRAPTASRNIARHSAVEVSMPCSARAQMTRCDLGGTDERVDLVRRPGPRPTPTRTRSTSVDSHSARGRPSLTRDTSYRQPRPARPARV